MSMSGRSLIAAAIGAALLLTAAYAALGGGRYEPPRTADPCEQRPSAMPKSTEALAERLTLAVLDGAACDLHLSREEIALAVFSDEERKRLARTDALDAGRIESAVRAGLLRTLADAERSGAIDEGLAALLVEVARFLALGR